jgi:hypothetical protein
MEAQGNRFFAIFFGERRKAERRGKGAPMAAFALLSTLAKRP